MSALAEFTPRLGQVLGIQDLTVDETGTLDLVFEDTLAVQILELVDSAELVFRANLGSVPDSSDRMIIGSAACAAKRAMQEELRSGLLVPLGEDRQFQLRKAQTMVKSEFPVVDDSSSSDSEGSSLL